jgi:hypothetical protein
MSDAQNSAYAIGSTTNVAAAASYYQFVREHLPPEVGPFVIGSDTLPPLVQADFHTVDTMCVGSRILLVGSGAHRTNDVLFHDFACGLDDVDALLYRLKLHKYNLDSFPSPAREFSDARTPQGRALVSASIDVTEAVSQCVVCVSVCLYVCVRVCVSVSVCGVQISVTDHAGSR